MTDLHSWAINQTINATWKNNNFHAFSANATQEEFLHSQEPFFYAVQAFPRFLSLLASMIEDSEQRMLVVENIWEEHGQGCKSSFHTNSYKTYLKALGKVGDAPCAVNPFVTDWIQGCLRHKMDSVEYAAYLAGIEYSYALLCGDVVKYIDTLSLRCEQTHYAKHAELDWEHGKELLDVAQSCINPIYPNQEDVLKKGFIAGQEHFLQMYSSLFLPTKKQIEEINKEAISFYYSRENSNLETVALSYVVNDKKESQEKPNILMICSGGEHIFELMVSDRDVNIDVIDINSHQIDLARKKLDVLLGNSDDESVLTEQNVGKFEKLFALLRTFFPDYCREEFLYKRQKENMTYVVEHLFSNENLNLVFGESATMYTKDSFAEHFSKVFFQCIFDNEMNTKSILSGSKMRDWGYLKDNIRKEHTLSWNVINPKDVTGSGVYDMIDISNIGDWMPQSEYQQVVDNCNRLLKTNGYLVARKLLGDYSLAGVLGDSGFAVEDAFDATRFYSEVVLAQKK